MRPLPLELHVSFTDSSDSASVHPERYEVQSAGVVPFKDSDPQADAMLLGTLPREVYQNLYFRVLFPVEIVGLSVIQCKKGGSQVYEFLPEWFELLAG